MGSLRQAVPCKMSSTSISALAAQLKNVPSSLSSGHQHQQHYMKESHGGMNNESMDSGVAGLRDGHMTQGGSPASLLLLQSPQQPVMMPSLLVDKLGDDVQQYIVDRSTRTTYLKGKFLGKVYLSIYIYYIN